MTRDSYIYLKQRTVAVLRILFCSLLAIFMKLTPTCTSASNSCILATLSNMLVLVTIPILISTVLRGNSLVHFLIVLGRQYCPAARFPHGSAVY